MKRTRGDTGKSHINGLRDRLVICELRIGGTPIKVISRNWMELGLTQKRGLTFIRNAHYLSVTDDGILESVTSSQKVVTGKTQKHDATLHEELAAEFLERHHEDRRFSVRKFWKEVPVERCSLGYDAFRKQMKKHIKPVRPTLVPSLMTPKKQLIRKNWCDWLGSTEVNYRRILFLDEFNTYAKRTLPKNMVLWESINFDGQVPEVVNDRRKGSKVMHLVGFSWSYIWDAYAFTRFVSDKRSKGLRRIKGESVDTTRFIEALEKLSEDLYREFDLVVPEDGSHCVKLFTLYYDHATSHTSGEIVEWWDDNDCRLPFDRF